MLERAPSYPQLVAARAAWDATRTNPSSTPEQLEAAKNAYGTALRRCAKEAEVL